MTGRTVTMTGDGYVRPSRAMLPYILGNGCALIIGLLSAYFALKISGTVPANILSQRTSDYLNFYAAGHQAISGHGALAYNWNAMLKETRSIAYPFDVPVNLFDPYFVYPPIAAALFAPLALLPFDASRALWFCLTVLALVWAAHSLEEELKLSQRGSAIFRFAAFTSYPVFQNLYQGQFSTVLLLAFVGTWVFRRRDMPGAAGACLAVALIKPQVLVVMLPVLVARREWALLRSFTVSAIALSAVGVVLLGPAATTGYVHVMTTLPQWGMHSGQMLNGSGESLYGFFHGITGWSAATVAWGASSAVILGFTCWYSTRQTDASASFAMAITGALLISPHLMSYGLTLALLAVTVMWSLARKRGLTTVPFLVAGYIAVVAGIPIEVLTGVKITPLVVALLTVALAWVGRRSPESASSTRLAPLPLEMSS